MLAFFVQLMVKNLAGQCSSQVLLLFASCMHGLERCFTNMKVDHEFKVLQFASDVAVTVLIIIFQRCSVKMSGQVQF